MNIRKVLSVILLSLTISVQGVPILLSWDANSPTEQVQRYYINQMVGANWNVVNSTTNTSIVMELAPGEYTFSVTASNFWGMSPRSKSVSTPSFVNAPSNIVMVIIQK